MNIQPGTDIGRYHILEQLGEGGMAVVYKAYDTRSETQVAVKIIRTENIVPIALEKARKRFEIETRKMLKLRHPNIVPVIDFGEYEGIPYLVMPYIPGGTLKQRLGKPIPWQEAVRIILPIADALSYAHKSGLVHRDVKPSNILIDENDQPLLTDFGIAKVLEGDETLDFTLTTMGIGTPEYMAPEQAEGKTVDFRADIYSLGIVLYEMITGRKPYIADTPMAVLIKQIRDPLPEPSQFVSNLPKTIEAFLIKTLSKIPQDRHQLMGEFSLELSSQMLLIKNEDKQQKLIIQQKKLLNARKKHNKTHWQNQIRMKLVRGEILNEAEYTSSQKNQDVRVQAKKTENKLNIKKRTEKTIKKGFGNSFVKIKRQKLSQNNRSLIFLSGLAVFVLGLVGTSILGKEKFRKLISNDLEKDQETFNQTAEFQPTITSIPTIKPKPTLSMVAAQEELFLPMEELVDYELMWEGFMNKPVEYGGALNLIASRAVFSPPNKFHIELIFDDVPEIIEIEKNNPNIGGFINLDIDNNILTGNEVDGVDYVLTYFFSGSLESKQIDLHKITKDDFTVFLRKYTRQPRGLNFYVGTNREYTFSFSPHGNALVIEFTLSVINSDTRIQIFPVVNAYDYGYEDLANISTNSDLSKIEMEIINTP